MVKVLSEGRILQILIFFLPLLTMSRSSTKGSKAVGSSSHGFGIKLYRLLSEEPGNLIFSSTSLEVVLALAHMGARGQTAQEILEVLELSKDSDIVKNVFQAIMTNLKSTEDMTLEIANKIYSEKTFSVLEEFQFVAEKSFLASAENVDFLNNHEHSRIAMNSWVEKHTRDKIKDLFQKGDVDSDTKMVLINAVYFKGKWKHQFDPQRTIKEPFYISASETKDVDMMHLKEKFGYAELPDLKAKMLVMPYVGDKMFMVILLPDAIEGLKEMEMKLNTINIVELMKKVDRPEVEVSLPRFKIEKTLDLKVNLQKLGITSMFDAESADFSGISKEKGLYVTKVVQKAFIEVNEEGSEAAAATASQIRVRRAASWALEFAADHPFIIHLCNDNGAIVFRGRIAEIEAEPVRSKINIFDVTEPPDKQHVEL